MTKEQMIQAILDCTVFHGHEGTSGYRISTEEAEKIYELFLPEAVKSMKPREWYILHDNYFVKQKDRVFDSYEEANAATVWPHPERFHIIKVSEVLPGIQEEKKEICSKCNKPIQRTSEGLSIGHKECLISDSKELLAKFL